MIEMKHCAACHEKHVVSNTNPSQVFRIKILRRFDNIHLMHALSIIYYFSLEIRSFNKRTKLTIMT